MLKRLTQSYYSKITLICIAVVCTITGSLLTVCSYMIQKQEYTEYLKNYDIAINNLSSALWARQNTLATDYSPLFDSTSNYDALCELYLSPNGEVDPSSIEAIVSMLSKLCASDQYCRGVLLLTRTGKLYQYDIRYDTIVPLNLKQTTFSFTPYRVQIISETQLKALSSDYETPASHVYGLSGTIFQHREDEVINLGYLIPLYSTSEFSTILSNARLDDSSIFTITDREQNIIYSSNDEYTATEHLLLPRKLEEKEIPHFLKDEPEIKETNTTQWYTSSIYNDRFQYFITYQVPTSLLHTTFAQTAVFLFGLFVCVVSIILYIIAFRLSDRKIKTIQKGMSQIGQNNLSYRMPIPKSNDEFSQIIQSFNGMCDALQQNVQKAYIFELAQKKAEIYAMQTSINPHFLYNALEQIRVQIMQGGYSDAAQMLLLLSKMYRNQTRRDLYISIGEELSYTETFINLYMHRYGNFEYEFIIENALKIYGIPKNTLQPLIENYFIHGYCPTFDDNLITVTLSSIKEEEKTFLQFVIEDNGSSITEPDLEELKLKLSTSVFSRSEDSGFALSNVNSRLKLVFGENSCLIPSIGSNHTGFKITFKIPPVLPEDLKQNN